MALRAGRSLSRLIAILGLCLAASWVLSASAFAQGRIAARHGDWQIRCEQPVGSPSEQCALVQNVEAEDRANVGLTVIFLRTADRQARILRVLAPLGVLLPSGLGLSIDGNEVGLAGFVRCMPEGCIAEVELDEGLIERFGAGRTATFVIFQTPEAGIGIPISLNGFTTGFSALDDPPPAPAVSDAPPEAPATPVPTTVASTTGDAEALLPPEDIDDRTELDRLLEDPLFPYLVAGIVLLLAVIIVIVLIATRGRRRAARFEREESLGSVRHERVRREERAVPRAPAQDEFDDQFVEGDGLDALEGGAAPPRRPRPRTDDLAGSDLAGSDRQRQLPKGEGARRLPASPRPPRR